MKGRVLQSTGSWYSVITENKQKLNCRIKGKYRLQGIKATNPIAVGDWVELEIEEGLETGIISDVLPRTNYIVRQSPRKKHHSHIIAANIDQAILIITFSRPRTSLGFIDRFLMAAEMYDIPTVLVFNKQDIYNKKDTQKYEEANMIYTDLGYETLLVSAETGFQMDLLEAKMKDKASLVAGHSGVGKSTLINYLDADLELDTRNISKSSGKGMHTTTFATMHELPFGGYIIDTPGIKEFGLVHVEPEDAGHYFVEIREQIGNCKFNNCLHRNEPGCVIIKGVENADIALSRYLNYLNVLDSIEEVNYWERK